VPADNPTGILALVNAYDEVDCHEDEATVLERYASAEVHNCFSTGSCLPRNSVTGFEGSRKTRRHERRAGKLPRRSTFLVRFEIQIGVDWTCARAEPARLAPVFSCLTVLPLWFLLCHHI
jgi:hypothetical protein